MQYKTIILELIQQQPELHEQLRTSRTLLSTLDQLAIRLREHHLALTEQFRRHQPQADETQLSNQAMEIAVRQFEEALSKPPESDEPEPELSLDAAMAYIKRHSPPA
ncbi:MAG: hypothetical protein AB7F89_16070 [Pirellulaceae bacterium]